MLAREFMCNICQRIYGLRPYTIYSICNYAINKQTNKYSMEADRTQNLWDIIWRPNQHDNKPGCNEIPLILVMKLPNNVEGKLRAGLYIGHGSQYFTHIPMCMDSNASMDPEVQSTLFCVLSLCVAWKSVS
jgi:hypothetical protein